MWPFNTGDLFKAAGFIATGNLIFIFSSLFPCFVFPRGRLVGSRKKTRQQKVNEVGPRSRFLCPTSDTARSVISLRILSLAVSRIAGPGISSKTKGEGCENVNRIGHKHAMKRDLVKTME